MKRVNHLHPFKVVISRGLRGSTVSSLYVNAGKVFNFYNPLNFRNVRFNQTSPELAAMPLPLSSNQLSLESVDPLSISLQIPEDAQRIAVYLFCTFIPPSKWVPAHYYIPRIDNAWVVFRIYTTVDDQTLFTLAGSVKNDKSNNIKYEVFDVNVPIPDGYDINSDFHKKFYEDSLNGLYNAYNVAIIAQCEKADGEWKINQFLKNNFPVTFFLNSDDYEVANTSLYNQNVLEVIPDSTEYNNYIRFLDDIRNNPLNLENVSDDQTFADNQVTLSTNYYRGYIQYYSDNISRKGSNFQLKFTTVSKSLKEKLYLFGPQFDV